MAEPILCLVALAFLGWIFVLKAEIKEKAEENRKLRAMLELGIREKTGDVEASAGKRAHGPKSWMKA